MILNAVFLGTKDKSYPEKFTSFAPPPKCRKMHTVCYISAEVFLLINLFPRANFGSFYEFNES